ncbi:hypothetical protein DFJ77DRAFT_511837 [Powellomyces hirtus]|nr:hypothetical protein DFJ77DRAFT_511837 [Powellomyces hirtus]
MKSLIAVLASDTVTTYVPEVVLSGREVDAEEVDKRARVSWRDPWLVARGPNTDTISECYAVGFGSILTAGSLRRFAEILPTKFYFTPVLLGQDLDEATAGEICDILLKIPIELLEPDDDFLFWLLFASPQVYAFSNEFFK